MSIDDSAQNANTAILNLMSGCNIAGNRGKIDERCAGFTADEILATSQ